MKEIVKTEVKEKPKAPFTTSTLQQVAIKQLKLTSKKVMQIAQQLYEEGLITYMRTDSTTLSDEAVLSIRQFVTSNIGDEYIPKEPNRFNSASKLAQEAHEAIRPTHVETLPSNSQLSGINLDIYKLIWERAVASQMEGAIFNKQAITLQSGEYLFKAMGKSLVFEGYLKVYSHSEKEDTLLPNYTQGQTLFPKLLIGKQNYTTPLSRYTEATLIKKLEKEGIGRPSTYATIISNIEARGYLRREKQFFVPEDVAFAVIDLLKEHFSNIVDIQFTAKMEDELDDIAKGKLNMLSVLENFYRPFERNLKIKEAEIKKQDSFEITEHKCPLCGSEMIVRQGKFGKFAGCTKYPDCKGIVKLEVEKDKNTFPDTKSDNFLKKYEPAPLTSDGLKMVLRKGKYGLFWSHPDINKKETKQLVLAEKCPQCDHNLVELKIKRKKLKGCSNYPNCKFMKDNGRKKQ